MLIEQQPFSYADAAAKSTSRGFRSDGGNSGYFFAAALDQER
jgi:hypothetical protein